MSDVSALNLEPDEVVGGYTLVSRLGAGAMGSVWRVTDGGGQTYAMKILRDSLTDGSSSDAAGVYGNPTSRRMPHHASGSVAKPWHSSESIIRAYARSWTWNWTMHWPSSSPSSSKAATSGMMWP